LNGSETASQTRNNFRPGLGSLWFAIGQSNVSDRLFCPCTSITSSEKRWRRVRCFWVKKIK